VLLSIKEAESMDSIILILVFIAAISYLAYRAYRFFVKKEVGSCIYSDDYQIRDEPRSGREKIE